MPWVLMTRVRCRHRYHLPFSRELALWIRRLAIVADVLEPWVRIQASFLYLDAVFTSGDIAVQLPVVARRFSNATRVWLRLMARVSAQPSVLQVCCNSDGVRQALPPLWEELERCQIALAGYLAGKRDAFPRAYFVSDNVLLELLARGSADPTTVAKHLPALADGPAALIFDASRRAHVVGIMSAEGEEIMFPHGTVVHADGPIEVWLQSFIAAMRLAVATSIARGLTVVSLAAQTGLSLQQAYEQVLDDVTPVVLSTLLQVGSTANPRPNAPETGSHEAADWLADFPMQVCVISYRVLWTALAERALQATAGGNQRALTTLHQYLQLRLTEAVELARQPVPQADTAPARSTSRRALARLKAARKRRTMVLEAIITLQTHHRDVCVRLVQEKARNSSCFSWRRELRSYYDVSGAERNCAKHVLNTICRFGTT